MPLVPMSGLTAQWRRLSPVLRGGLLVTLAACLWVWWDERAEPAQNGAPVERLAAATRPAQARESAMQVHGVHAKSLALEPAQADPFASPTLAAVPRSVPQPAVPAPPAPEPEPPPYCRYRVLGVMKDAQGQLNVYVGAPAGPDLLVRAGLVLDDGFVVQGWDAQALDLLHPASGTRQRLPLPRSDGGES